MDDLLTARLILHPMNVAEATRVVAGTPDAGDRWAPGYPAEGDVKGAQDFLGHCVSTGNPQPFGNYEIRRRADGMAIGGLGFHRPPDEHGDVTIGYALIPQARGKGYATEALRALLALARSHGVRRVKGDADHDNIASQRVMAAAGMRLVAEEEGGEMGVPAAGGLGKVVYYEIAWTGATPAADTPASPATGADARSAGE